MWCLAERAKSAHLAAASLLNVVLAGCLVLADKVLGIVLGEPVGKLGDLLAEAVDGLLVHVGLCDELREAHWTVFGERGWEKKAGGSDGKNVLCSGYI